MRLLRDVALLVLVTGAYVAAGKLGLALAFENPSVSPVWPPTGIALAALLVLGRRFWPAVWVGAFIVNITTTGTAGTSLVIATGNTLEAVLGAWLITRFANGRRAFESTRDLLTFALFGGLLSPIVSASLGVASLTLAGHAPSERLLATWATWWLGDVVGALVVAPLLLMWYADPKVRCTRREAVEVAFWFALIGFVSVLFFTGITPSEFRPYIRPFPLIPLLICLSIRFGAREAATGLALLSGIAIWGTLRGFGPFILATANESLLMLQCFLGVASVLTLAPAVMIAEHRRVERRLQGFVEQAGVGIAECDPDYRFLRMNERFCDMLGYSREELFARSLLDITHPDDRATTQERFELLKRGGGPSSLDKRYIRSDGTTFWANAAAFRLVPGPGLGAYVATVVEDITHRKLADEALQKAAALEERHRLAGEIHDDLAQSCIGIVLHLENAAEVFSTDRKAARRHIDQATQLARGALTQARRSIQSLRPKTLEEQGLPAALRAAAAGLLAGTAVELDFRCEGAVQHLPPDIESEIFYIAREALTNAWRHAGASRLSCQVQYAASELRVGVTDNGRGFEVGGAQDTVHFGLASMRERAGRIGAQLTIQSRPGQTTLVNVRLPLPHSPRRPGSPLGT